MVSGGRPPSLAENFRSDTGVVVMISTGDEGSPARRGLWPPSFPEKQWVVHRASSAPAKIAAKVSRRQAADGVWAATPAKSAMSAMSLFTTQSPTGVAITSSWSKKEDRFVADLN
ncbi:unnamed protein product [Cuscuta campestris]|uniref:Uncharacterized protein n=1 Tax=Cuscuta campestris TaxID=132261 RepID=A0A484LLM8_9ASTE|nr:unnamed protein product [Cuscuta campestris]